MRQDGALVSYSGTALGAGAELVSFSDRTEYFGEKVTPVSSAAFL